MDNNVTRINYDNKELILIGTAHVSKQSALQVKEIIEQEQPDSVCIELDSQRYQTITDKKKWKQTDIFKIIKEKKATLLLVNLIMSSFQRRLANKFGINPGQEMMQGIQSAKDVNAKLVLADRNIQITFRRIWRKIGFISKLMLLVQIIASIFVDDELSEEDLEELKSKDMLAGMLDQFAKQYPQIKEPLIDERDRYLAQKIKTAPGHKVVAVLGAAHIPGITQEIDHEHDLTALCKIPPKSSWSRFIPWLIPALIIAIIGYTFFINKDVGIRQSISWILWNGSFSAIGAALAFSHPLTIITAFIIAPISSINPLVAAGWASGIVEALLKKPRVADFESLANDITSFKGFWKNKVTHLLLVIVLTNIGSTLGTFIGGIDVIRMFLETV